MSHAERQEIERAVSASTAAVLAWHPHADPRFIRLLTPGGCPLLARDGAQTRCTVYAVRPTNCRTHGCFRMDVTTEPVPRTEADRLINVMRSRDYQRQAIQMERKGQRWGATRGWP